MTDKKLKEGLGDLAHMAERDHEVQMARAELYKIAKYAIKLHEMLKGVSEAEGIEGWMQSKITKAADYVGSVYHTLEYDMLSANETQKFAGMSEEVKDEYKNTLAERMSQKKTELTELDADTYYKYWGKAYDDVSEPDGKDPEKLKKRRAMMKTAAAKHNKAKGWERPQGVKKDAGDASKSAAALAKHLARKDRQAAKAEESLDEKAKSKAQQRFMGMVHATQKGEPAPSKEVAKVAKEMPKKAAKDYASTKHKGKPEHVKKK
jgi:hypothetical protein